jgi:hypothetical protein
MAAPACHHFLSTFQTLVSSTENVLNYRTDSIRCNSRISNQSSIIPDHSLKVALIIIIIHKEKEAWEKETEIN